MQKLPAFLSRPTDRSRARDGAVLLRTRRRVFRLLPLTPATLQDLLALASRAPGVVPAPVGVIHDSGTAWLVQTPPRGVRLDRDPRRAERLQHLALLIWRTASAGHAPADIDHADLVAGTAALQWLHLPPAGREPDAARALSFAASMLAGRRATAAGGRNLASPVSRILGGERAGVNLMRTALAALPAPEATREFVRTVLDAAVSRPLPCAIAVPDAEQARAVATMVLAECARRGLSAAPAAPLLHGDAVRVMGPISPEECARRLERLSAQPAIVIVTGTHWEAERELGPLAQVHHLPEAPMPELLDWLKPLGLPLDVATIELAPFIGTDQRAARGKVMALVERAGVTITGGYPSLMPEWRSALSELERRPTGFSVAHPAAARLADLLSLSPLGLNADAVDAQRDLAPGAAVLRDLGLAVDEGDIVRGEGLPPVAGTTPAQRRAALQWLAERPHFAPETDSERRKAWALALTLRSGDISAWTDTGPELCHRLIAQRAFEHVLLLHEAHATTAARFGVGPPSIESLLDFRDLALAFWTPRRMRRVFRLWLRAYHGPLRPLTLALLAQVERTLGALSASIKHLAEARELTAECPRLEREQALIECAACVALDDPGQAEGLLRAVSEKPLRDIRYLSRARMLIVRSQIAFIQLRAQDVLSLLQLARDSITPRAPWLRRARVEGEIESYRVSGYGVATNYERDSASMLADLHELERQHGCLNDLVRRATVNDYLFRARLKEVGALSPDELENALANAPPHNRRGYMIVLYQLAENAAYRGELTVLRQLGARIEGMQPSIVNPVNAVTWPRYKGIAAALEGRWAESAQAWRQGGTTGLAEPWRSRSRALKRNEWGITLMLAGKFERAASTLFRAIQGFMEIRAGGRVSSAIALRACALLLIGRPVPEDEINTLRELVARGHMMPALALLIAEAEAHPSRRATLRETLEELRAPPLWRAGALCVAAVLARRAGAYEAPGLAEAARAHMPEFAGALKGWLATEFPEPSRPATELPPSVLSELFRLTLRESEPNPEETLLKDVVAGLERVYPKARSAAVLRLEAGYARAGDQGLQDTAEVATLGGEVHEAAVCAVPLLSHAGAVASRVEDARSPEVLRAFARRMDELLALASARRESRSAGRRRREVAHAAWTLASRSSVLSRLEALATLARSETGALHCSLALIRGGGVILETAPRSDSDLELSRRVDHSVTLVLRAVGGDRDALERASGRCAEAVAQMLREGARLRQELGSPGAGEVVEGAGEPLGASGASRRLYDELRRLADLDMPVVISGESGAGKDFSARTLHAMSRRATLPLVAVECSTLRPETAASELFGHMRGAFTGATHDHIGLLETAGEGILMFDGIGSLQPSIQAMLLRALQIRRFMPVGSTTERQFKARVLVTTDGTLEELVAAGALREDLSQRLVGLNVRVPALRDRGEDILLFARITLERQAAQLGRKLRFSRHAEQHLLAQTWPGNIRQLKAVVTRAAVLCDGEVIGVEDLRDDRSYGAEAASEEDGLNLTRKMALGLLRQRGELTPRELMRNLGIGRTTASGALMDLVEQGFAQRAGKGRASRYTPT